MSLSIAVRPRVYTDKRARPNRDRRPQRARTQEERHGYGFPGRFAGVNNNVLITLVFYLLPFVIATVSILVPERAG